MKGISRMINSMELDNSNKKMELLIRVLLKWVFTMEKDTLGDISKE